MIDAGLPATKEEWPTGVVESLSSFRQGSLFRLAPGLYWGDPNVSVHRQTAAYAPDEAGPCEFDEAFPYGMVLSQTCDVVEEDARAPRFPWVEICPVYPIEWLPEDRRGNAKRGRVLYLVPVHPEGEAGDWIADLRLRVSVEKGWLAQQAPLSPFQTEEAYWKLAKLLAWRAQRPAFDGRFVKAVQQPLVERLAAIRADDADLFDLLDEQIAEFGLRAADHLAMTDVEVYVLLNEPASEHVLEFLNTLWDDWEARARDEQLNLLPLQIALLSEISAATYCSLTHVPLRGLSPDD